MVDLSGAFKNESKNLGLPAYGISDHKTNCCEPACAGHFVCTFGEEAGISRKIVQQRKCSACGDRNRKIHLCSQQSWVVV